MPTLRLATAGRSPLHTALGEARDWMVAAPAFPRSLLPPRRLLRMAVADGPRARSLVPSHPLVLVHGCIGNPTTWRPLVRRLHRRGLDAVYAFGYTSFGVDVPELAERLLTQVEQEFGQEPVHLVGHSLGGLIARYVTQELAADTAVATLTTIATPNRGAGLARLLPTALGRDLRPDSPIIRELASRPLPGASVTTAYYTDRDLLVPQRSATLCSPDAEDVAIPGFGHLSILNAPRLADELVSRLRHAERLTRAVPKRSARPILRAVGGQPSLP
ncbi:MAG: triacylglycerol lipase [Frankiaceae bacterium]|nr:triacylglycerol lipase [Frankiaceae bacterium]